MIRSLALKRAFDVVVSALALMLLIPILAFVAVGVHVRMGSPVLFRQARPGLHGRTFEILKFRTMLNANGSGDDSDAQRLTAFGRWLRATSLDELPGLLNVLRGDMSLVGPRPLLEEYLPLYSPDQARRHEVRPGVTGWAQVNGRNAISWEDKFRLDVWYVDNRSFWLDIRILLLTIRKVFRSEGISSATSATMERFMGSGAENANTFGAPDLTASGMTAGPRAPGAKTHVSSAPKSAAADGF